MKTARGDVRRPTIKEVAKLAGVSFKTVARVVNNEPNVTAERRAAVVRAMKMLDYRPNISARQLRSEKSFLIALLYDIAAEYVAHAQAGAIGRCREAGYHLIVEAVPRGSEEAAAQRLKELNVDGVIVAPPASQREAVLSALRTRGLRHALIAPGPDAAAPSVAMDDREAARQMTEALIGLGHRRIAFISGGQRHASKLRQAGYEEALQAAGLEAEPDLIAVGDFLFRSGESAAVALLDAERPPSAIFAANDAMALGALVAAARKGVPVPQQLSIAGFDDLPLSTIVWPQLATVRQPLAEMAAAAVDLLLERQLPEPPPRILLDFQIVRRESIGPAPRI